MCCRSNYNLKENEMRKLLNEKYYFTLGRVNEIITSTKSKGNWSNFNSHITYSNQYNTFSIISV